jgi:hypothetical protein
MSGVAEESVEFPRPFDLSGPERFRRIAGVGPVYEAIEDRGAHVLVRMVDTGEEFDYRKADAELDPTA